MSMETIKESEEYYDSKNVKTMGTFKETVKFLGFLLIVFILCKLPSWVSVLSLFAYIGFVFRSRLATCKNHKIHIKLDDCGSIQVFDNSLELIAVIFKSRCIDYQRECSFWKMSKIKDVSDHFEDYTEILEGRGSVCL